MLRLIRVFSYAGFYFFSRWLPASVQPYGGKMARRIRLFICRPLFEHCGKNVNIEHGADFGSGSKLSIGDESGIGVNCRVPYDITIGKDVMMGPGVSVIGVNHDIDDVERPMIMQGYGKRAPVVIDDDVWIGRNAIILAGIHIGQGVVIGAGAVVTKDVKAFDIVAGNPARVIRNRKDGRE